VPAFSPLLKSTLLHPYEGECTCHYSTYKPTNQLIMKTYFKLFIFIASILAVVCLQAQNPNWTLPGDQFNLPSLNFSPLPQSPIDPGDGMPETDPTEAYQGAQAEHVHTAYSDPSGDLLFFTVDEKVYDKSGWVVGDLQTGFTKKGWNERLILPMGNDCNRFAIIYPASAASSESYGSTDDRMRIYMAVYDLNGTNAYNEYALGDLEGQTGAGAGSSLTDITDRDCQNESPTYPGIYGCGGVGDPVPQANYRGNYQIATTGLIDNCFFYVYIFDGEQIMRYRLDDTGLLWDDYVQVIPQSGSNGFNQRTEMELIQLGNGDYRIAIPTYASDGPYISIYDIDDSNYELDMSSHQQIDLSRDGMNQTAEMSGLEFDQTGRYLYFTHENNNTPQWQTTVLDVYDFNTSSIVTSSLPTLTNISDYQYSFIERYGNTLYLVSDDDIAILENSHTPGSAIWTSNFQSISSGYKNKGGETFAGFERSILPDQLDMAYPNLADLSCDCCAQWNTSIDRFEATTSATWATGMNPFGGATDVYIRDELVINPGVDITIDNMNFYFAPDARVVVKREDQGSTGAYLKLTGGTVFTADLRCSAESFPTCDGPDEDCEKEYWKGIIVEGFENNTAQSWTTSTPHGRLLVEDNSMIEFAIEGARAGGSTVSNSGGGMIRMVEARIKDCKTGVRFDPYVKLAGASEVYTRSYIKESRLWTSSDWFDSGFPYYHVYIDGSSGINLYANIFENTDPTSFSVETRGFGIFSLNSVVYNSWTCASPNLTCPPQDVIRSEFNNLRFGILAYNFGSTRTIADHHSLYKNNFIGVRIEGVDYPEILDGTFQIMPSSNSTGIYLNGSTGYLVQNNYLETYNGSSDTRNIGIYVDDSGPANNEIYRNFFYNLTRGGVTVDKNADDTQQYVPGLDWICNEFESPIFEADLYLDGTLSEEQGLCLAPDVPAGNLFSHSGTGHYDAYSTFGSFAVVDYNYHDNAPANAVPLTISNNNAPQDWVPALCVGINYGRNTCAVKKTSLDDGFSSGYGEGPKSNEEFEYALAYISEQAAILNSAITDLEGDVGEGEDPVMSDELKLAHYENDVFWQEVARSYVTDTLGIVSVDEMVSLLGEFQPKSVERFASKICPEDQQEWISEKNASYYTNFGDMILPTPDENDQLPTDITELFESEFFTFKGNIDALIQHYINHNSVYDPYFIESEIEGLEDDTKSNSSAAEINDQKVLVQPNPFSNQVLFDISELNIEDQDARIEIYDLVGKRVFESVIPAGQNQIQMDGGNLPSGYLTFSIVVDGEKIETGKLLHINK